MLKIHKVDSPLNKQALLEGFNPAEEAWIVSDLQSKWHLQRGLLQSKGVLEEQCILRASELWRRLAVQLLPTTRLLSAELTQSLFWHWLEERPEPLSWLRTPNSLNVLLQQMRQWISVFSDPNYQEQMQAWFQDNLEYYQRWGQWFEISREIWDRCVEENVTLPNWLPALLLQQDLSTLELPRKLKFDLGVQLTPVEGKLIHELSQHFEVEVVQPNAVWSSGFSQPMHGYRVLSSEGRPEAKDFDWSTLGRAELSFVRYSTRVAEVKAAVAQVRQWLDQGVESSRIGLIAPDIEEHWPILNLYLEQEGIFVRKSRTARLHSFPEMTKWLANLRLACEQLSTADLEAALFMGEDKLSLPFAEFRVLYSNIYGVQDLQRSTELAKRWSEEKFSTVPITQEEFFVQSARYWRGSEKSQGYLEKFAQFITQDCPRDLKLMPREWLSYWQGVLSRIEIPIQEEFAEGIWCVSLSSTDWLDLSYGFFLNMSGSGLRQLSQSPVSFQELEKLEQDLGYPLDSPDHQQLEFEFLWMAEKKWTQFIGSFAQSDAQGTVLTPSRLWLWGAHLQGKIPKIAQAPAPTRWDELQRASLPMIAEKKSWPLLHQQQVEQALLRDEGKVILDWPRLKELNISASGLEKYFECPFKFTASRVFHLSDDALLDLDMDRMASGSLMHALFARLMVEPIRYDWTDNELAILVNECAKEESIELGEPGLWPAKVKEHVQLGRSLLAMEKSWREKFPKLKTLGREIGFSAFWNLETHQPSKIASAIQMRGRLDRVDGDGQGYAVIDYKSSASKTTNLASWLESDSIQLSLYAQMLELGMTELPPGPVEAAHYYVVKKQMRHKGYFSKDAVGDLFDPKDKMFNWRALVNRQGLELHRQDLNLKISGAIQGILSGDLGPKPKKPTICKDCHWRSVCRSPHLN